jgi:hypothetical protein
VSGKGGQSPTEAPNEAPVEAAAPRGTAKV